MALGFENTGETLSSFADEFLVNCPRCRRCARVTPVTKPRTILRSGATAVHARVLCTDCAYAQDKGFERRSYGTAHDPYFSLSLWLQTPCCGETLWAYNYRHLAYVERYVQADLRDECSYPNTGLARYLPQWMKSAKNRNEVLKCIRRLKHFHEE